MVMLLDCIYLYQDTTLQANHNNHPTENRAVHTVFIYIKIQLCKQTTTDQGCSNYREDCIYLYQDTTLQANHNACITCTFQERTVFIYIKIQLCKQTTTRYWILRSASYCIYLYQDTTLQANHNSAPLITFAFFTVFIYIKIQLCKQTTTKPVPFGKIDYCIYLYQDTTLQANHNQFFLYTKAKQLYLSISRYNFASKPQLTPP